MPRSAIDRPAADPTPIFEAFRGNYATELLTAAVAHLGVFARLAGGSKPAGQLRQEIGLEERPYLVLMTAMRALGLVEVDDGGLVSATDLAREYLTPGAAFGVSEYIG